MDTTKRSSWAGQGSERRRKANETSKLPLLNLQWVKTGALHNVSGYCSTGELFAFLSSPCFGDQLSISSRLLRVLALEEKIEGESADSAQPQSEEEDWDITRLTRSRSNTLNRDGRGASEIAPLNVLNRLSTWEEDAYSDSTKG